jgi:hypothetical protein
MTNLTRNGAISAAQRTWRHLATLIISGVLVLPLSAFGYGEENPTGLTGGFNGWVTSAGSYDQIQNKAIEV